MTNAPTTFISYSWDDDEHRSWVQHLVTRLRQDGVNATVDEWSTAPGDQLPMFMEKAIRSNDFVIIVCTPRYKTRSDDRKGGVGYEGDIMTAEVMADKNHRKFIPILRRASWRTAAPSWVRGKRFVDLRDGDQYENGYSELVKALHRKSEQGPPVRKRRTRVPSRSRQQKEQNDQRSRVDEFADIEIVEIIEERISVPSNDGSAGSALYSIPFRLSRQPPAGWAEMCIQKWDRPSTWTTMHRPGIARIQGDVFILDGTTIGEVEKYHRSVMLSAVAAANELYRVKLRQRQEAIERQRASEEAHRRHVSGVVSKIKFDKF